MQLWVAIGLGRTLENGGDGFSYQSCAIGLGMAAMGVDTEERCSDKAISLWPWLLPDCNKYFGSPMNRIGVMYFDILAGIETLDQLIDYVRSIEPPEEVPTLTQEIHAAPMIGQEA